MSKKIKFVLDGCDISFIGIAPKDITLEQLLKQCNKIEPHWCACGIRSLDKENGEYEEEIQPDIIIDYDNIQKANEDVNCNIKEK